ncbi:GGDEF domain-containing protein [Raoultibacter phocaeensis]|uniref:GGDEF domain-containing protein n=1 Tax=Raoultibacter phocaeensis TaxID=2479841 RepID=UPI0015D57F49|nr:diguanylate cyclase [Raoultibacter phocaeensis]
MNNLVTRFTHSLKLRQAYFSEQGDEIAVRNLEFVRLGSFVCGTLFILYYALTALLFPDFTISPLYGLIILPLAAFALYAHTTLKSGRVSARKATAATILFYLTAMAYLMILSVFPHPDIPSVYFSLFLVLAPIAFLLPAYMHLAIIGISVGAFWMLVVAFKAPEVWYHEVFTAATAVVFAIIALFFMSQFRLQTDSLKMKYYQMSRFDALTEAMNKAAGLAAAQTYIDQKNNLERFAVFFIDIDGFKSINDTYGHMVGDRILQSVGKALTETCRKNDIVCRFGGDEFLIVLKDIENVGEATAKARAINAAVRTIDVPNAPELTCSIGIKFCTQNCTNIEDAIADADAALYRAKHQGRNQYFVYGNPAAASV